MQSPNYRWRCHRCQETNEAGTERCHTCGFPAVADGRLIEGKTAEQNAKNDLIFDTNRDFYLYFPEIIPAALIVLYSPVWTFSLLLDGHYWAAFCLLPVVIPAVIGFWYATRRKRKWLAYLAIVSVLIDALGVQSLADLSSRKPESCGQPAKTDKILSCTANPKA